MNATLTSKHVGDNGSKSKVHAMPNSDVDGRKAVCGRSVKWVNANAHGYDHEVTCLACVKVMRAAEATENTDRLIAESEARLAAAHVVESATEGKWDAVLRTTSSAGFNTVPEVGYVGVRQALVGFGGDEHIHAAGCRDIRREMRKFGQREGDTFPYPAGVTVWNVIEENDGGRASDSYTVGTLEHAQEMVWNANAELRFMPCASMQLGMTPFGPLIMAEDGNYMISDDRTDTRAYVESLGLSESRVSGLDAESAFVDMLSPNGEPWGEMRNLSAYGNNEMFPAMLSMIGRDWDSFTLYDMGCYVVIGIIDPCKAGSIMSVLVWSARCENTPCEYAPLRAAEDAEALEYDALVDNIMDTLTVDALLSVDVDGIKVSLGWHTFTVKRGDERSIPTIYGEAHGEWNRPTAANWDSIITVEDSKTY